MKQFSIDDDVVALLRELGKPQEFDSFSDVLRRVLTEVKQQRDGRVEPKRARSVDELLSELAELPNEAAEKVVVGYKDRKRLRAPSPDPQLWVSLIPELRSVRGLNTWRAVCDHLDVEVGVDSARRRLQEWVRVNRPKWHAVPDA